jgi:hypothetical protein
MRLVNCEIYSRIHKYQLDYIVAEILMNNRINETTNKR